MTFCYRGLHFHLTCASPRVDLNVTSFLECQIICFLLVSLRPSALAVIFSPELGLRNPSAFFSCCTSCTLCHLLLSSHRCLHFLGCVASVCCYSPMLYVAVSCYSLAFGLLFSLLWSLLSIKSLAYMYYL